MVGTRALVDRVSILLTPVLAAAGFDLEGVEITRAGARSVLRILVDRDGGVDLDGVAQASRTAVQVLDAADPIAGAYVLEVSSPGVDRPLTAPRHWRRAVGRLVGATVTGGARVEGRVLAADDVGADLETPTGPARLDFADVRGAQVRVEFDRPGLGRVGVGAPEGDDVHAGLPTRADAGSDPAAERGGGAPP